MSSTPTRVRSGRSSKFGTVNYSADEMRRLNAKVRAVLPLASEDWLRVAYQFNHLRPEAVPYREVESLKRKFKKMYCTRGKTLPDYIREAKELRKLINQRLDKVTARETEMETEQEAGDLALKLKLRQMEDEYHRTLEGKRAEAVVAVTSQGQEDRIATSTSGVIAMLRKSVERKRCAAEEQVLDENARVRRERKRRKMEQVLLSIHQEQRDLEVAERGNGAATEGDTEAVETENSLHDAELRTGQQVLPALSAGASTTSSLSVSLCQTTQPSSMQDTPFGMMEMLLQFMTAQQRENAQRLETDQARRVKERRDREERLHEKELRQQREHRELMLAMGTLLGDRFPDSLRHYLNGEDQHQQSTASISVSAPPTDRVVVPTQDKNAESSSSSTQSPAQKPPLSSTTTNRRDTEEDASAEGDCVKTRGEQQAGIRVHDATSAML
ncbi:hypothetical protein JG687_00012346 [Phytophthora cactorum]|uniref:DUF6818 domain-containing protein n=1 Tax=Phytophthora cactorum TaxID=29920 RepID=A0A329RY60_9STRA|nr:hypothetical protein Pcac1_g12920 [Phytophthora cactorum]KAG2816572.1 hypothetical protein PC112_g13409 [Phytophthora cactorum]KAG2819239.1 hypothetical protein PC111_g11974 [Phytophthora cactorum]KAG2853877.1 hypothetical protein PC113_g13805 [Phytophthora cactorum]KAG2897775.1 hypothetical protein PC114_g14543 [Phytophthora cactorum]